MVELLRHIPGFSFLSDFLNCFVDTRDLGEVVVTHTYLLFGCGFPLILGNMLDNNELLKYAGLISLGIGDSMASLVGVYYGKSKWPYRNKTYVGTLACWISMIVFCHLLGFDVNCLLIIELGLIALYETYTTLIDNLVLPLFASGVIILLN